MSQPEFVHLHVHSHFSLLDGAAREADLVSTARNMGMKAVALTDHGNLFGAVNFYKAAKKAEIKPIIGYEAYVAPGDRTVRKQIKDHRTSYHLTLLAQNETGYRNLCKLASTAYVDGFYYKPRIDRKILSELKDGLIVLSGCLSSELSFYIQERRDKNLEELLEFYKTTFGEKNFFLEIQYHGLEKQKPVMERTVELAAAHGLGLAATNDVHYVNRTDAKVQDALLCINTGKLLSEDDRMRMDSDEFYFKSAEDMEKTFGKYDGALSNTVEIADRCEFDFSFGTYHIPTFNPPDKLSEKEYLRKLCEEGCRELYPDFDSNDRVKERLDYELGVIDQMGFNAYFLIVWDFIRYAREKGIAVGPGRGSAAGSIVAYSLGITKVEPLRYNLFFERFLNPSRVSMPDIDIDFCMERREEVIDYVREKYGDDSVCQIITYGTLKARAVLRDVARVLDIPLGEVDRIAKLVPAGPKVNLTNAFETEPELKKIRNSKPEYEELFSLAEKLEGLNRHSGVHAAGVVITPEPLTEYLPLAREKEGITTQFEMSTVEEIGLLKMDFLGLRTLTIIEKALDNVEATTGERIDIDRVTLEDRKTFEMLSRGESEGVFQLESSGMKGLLRSMKPDTFEDLIALIALYRPGPLGSDMDKMYVKRKHGEEEVEYPHPDLEEILKETYGVIVYQEQVMQIANVLAGFSLAEADKLRKAMGKKIPEILEKFKDQFVSGAVERGVEKKTASHVFELIEYFAGYGFNKSHSTAYALIAYQTAYLKAHYPREFMAALLTCDMGNTDKVKQYYEELKLLGIRLLPPDVQESYWHFSVKGEEILYGLGGIKGVGRGAADAISTAREEGGKFTSLYDFCERVDLSAANKGAIEALIKAGTFDSMGHRRSQLAEALPEALKIGQDVQRTKKSGQGSLFDAMNGGAGIGGQEEIRLPDIPEWPKNIKLASEKECLGFWLSAHPLEEHRTLCKTYATVTSKDLSETPNKTYVVVGGMLSSVRKFITKKGNPMAFLGLEDLTGALDAVVFPDLYEKTKHLLEEDTVLFLAGELDAEREPPSIKVDEVIPVDEVRAKMADSVLLMLDLDKANEATLEGLKDAVKSFSGACGLVLQARSGEEKPLNLRVGVEYCVRPCDDFLSRLREISGVREVREIPKPATIFRRPPRRMRPRANRP